MTPPVYMSALLYGWHIKFSFPGTWSTRSREAMVPVGGNGGGGGLGEGGGGGSG